MRWHERVQAAWANPALNWHLQKLNERGTKNEAVSWLRQETWHVFWTQTYRGKHSECGAMVRWLRFLADHNLLSLLKAHMWAVEPHATYPSHHVHALLSFKSPKCLKSFLQDWRGWKETAWRELGKALILEADEKAPIYYALKYVLKTSGTSVRGAPQANGASRTRENLWGIWTSSRKESRLWS